MSYFTLWILGFFNTILVSNSLDPDQAQHFVGPDLGPNCLQRLSAVSRQQKLALAGKELNTKQLVDTTFWLKPWLKLISFHSHFFFIWLKCWLLQILSQGKPCLIDSIILCFPGVSNFVPDMFGRQSLSENGEFKYLTLKLSTGFKLGPDSREN